MKNYEFRAVCLHNQGEDKHYESMPIGKVTEPFTTIGVYKNRKDEESGLILQDHLVDMPIEEFQQLQEARFPNGVTSWKETHFEMVASITVLRGGEPFLCPGDILPLVDKIHPFIQKIDDTQGTGGFYELAEDWTNEFELKHLNREWDGEYYDEIEEFVKQKLKENEEV